MNKSFYAKMALTNIKNNKKNYIPYILTGIGTVMMFFIIVTLALSDKILSMTGGYQLSFLLRLGTTIIGIFSTIFLFYTNSFLIKGRKKEFGLYNILGMEKRHIYRVIFFETLIVYAISVLGGLLTGAVFSKAVELLMFQILRFSVSYGFVIVPKAIISTLIVFSIIFLLILLNSLRLIKLSKPIELLRGGQVGEREPKSKWIIAILGLISLGYGYYLALTIKQPLEAMLMFFVAVFFVIIGTYLLFMAGSIVFLKLLKKNKSYYYKTNHFVSVSGMMYRMKRNSVGLANICILSTMVLVMLSTTISLYVGMEDVMSTRYPRDMTISTVDYSEETIEKVQSVIDTVLKGQGDEALNVFDYRYISFTGANLDGTIYLDRNNLPEGTGALTSLLRTMYFLPLEDYNRLTGENKSLNEDEVFVYSNRTSFKENVLELEGFGSFKVKEKLKSFPGNGDDAMRAVSSHFVVVRDMNIIEDLNKYQESIFGDNKSNPTYYIGFNLSSTPEKQIETCSKLMKGLEDSGISGMVESKEEARDSFFSLYGGLFFLGIFLGTLFILATVLIIYYKQISEGFEDRQRFIIMQQVGMSPREVKKAISSQVLTVFFLPLITAGVHIAVAFPLISKLIQLLNLTNLKLYALVTLLTFLIFSVFYVIVYVLTSSVYYKLVSIDTHHV